MNKNFILLSIFIILLGCKQTPGTNEIPDTTDTINNNIVTNITVTSVNTANYISRDFNFISPTQISFDKTAMGGNAYTKVYGFNIDDANRGTGFIWNDEDENTGAWRPQGICGYSNGTNKYLIVSWYALTASYKGSRISIIDINPISDTYLHYRHILLVQPDVASSSSYTQLSTYAPLDIHAGGIACYKNYLYIASTDLGLRVFDINKIIQVTDTNASTKCGKDSNGNTYAFTYLYVLPQIRYYKIEGGANPFSTVQINNDSTELWTAQYYAQSTGKTPQIYGFPIDENGTLKTTGIKSVIPKNSLFKNNNAYGIQGIFRRGIGTWLSCTGMAVSNNSTARLLHFVDGNVVGKTYNWPYGAESLYYDTDNDYLWSLTEFEPDAGANNGDKISRCVFAVKLSNYK